MNKEEEEVKLYIHTDKKIEKIKEEVSGVIQSILSQGQKLDQLSERINEGVSKTAYKTLEKVTDISIAITDLKHDAEKRDVVIRELKDGVKDQKNNWNIFIRAVLFSILAGIVVAVWKF